MILQPPTVLPVGDLTGNDVVNIEGERLGTIASYAIDLEQGRIAYAVLSFGGFRGLATNGLLFPGTQCSSLPVIGSSSSM
jgi:hypothetical protein